VIDGKTTQGDRISERQINWLSLTDHKKRRNARFIAVAGTSFAGGDLLERAEEHEVTLIETETLVKLLEMHDRTPMNLEDFREIFEKKGVLRLEDCPELMTRHAEYERQQKLFPEVLKSLCRLQQQEEPTHASDVRWTLGREFEQEDILDTLNLLERWGFVKKATGDHWISLMSTEVAARRFKRITDSFEA